MVKYLVGIFSLFLALAMALQLLFLNIQRDHSSSVLGSVRSILRNELNFEEPYRLAESLTDLEDSGLLRCSVLKKEGAAYPFIDLTFRSPNDCTTSIFTLKGSPVKTELESISGKKWTVSFIANKPPRFDFLFWLTRFTSLVFAVSAGYGLFLFESEKENKLAVERAIAREIAKVATDVAHDIRSPLAALRVAVAQLEEADPLNKKLINISLSRINAIAEGLLSQARQKKPSIGGASYAGKEKALASREVQLVAPLLDRILLEKNATAQLRNPILLVAGEDVNELAGNLNEELFSRMISNLLNNSIEATSVYADAPLIRLRKNSFKLIVEVIDHGPGIPKPLLEKLGASAVTTKENGNGIGLTSAKEFCDQNGGNLSIESNTKGTLVRIELPAIDAGRIDTILIDDDPLNRKIWSIAAVKSNAKFISFSHFDDFIWAAKYLPKEASVFVDMDLGTKDSGTAVARKLSEMGFKEIRLATGHSKVSFGPTWKLEMPFLLDIVGKAPPWPLG